MSKVYGFEVKDSRGNDVSLEKYKGKVMLVVNTASKCGFTPQYEGLQKLYDTYNKEGLEILAFPCNQFGKQEAGNDEEIQSFCQINFGLTFPVFGKLEVNGDNEHPLYTHLKEEQKGLLGRKIKWNFTKFLVDRDGNVVKRFASTVTPEALVKDIEKYM